jgi:ABC-type branched-subunit amino acid transport system substrate-binding protein
MNHLQLRYLGRATVGVLALTLGLGGLLASPASAAGNGGATAPGVTANSISIGTTTPLTGPAAPGYDEIAAAANAVFQWVNAQGGIYGRKIHYTIDNDEYDPALTATLTRQLVLQQNIFADVGPLGTPTDLAVQPFLNSQGVPQLFAESGCACWSESKYPWTFGWQPNYIVEGKIVGQYVKQHLSKEKIGYLYQDDEFGQDGVKGLNEEIPAKSVVGQQTYVATTTGLAAGLGNQISALKAAGAQVVVLYTIPAATALALLAAAEIGYSPKWVVSSVGADPATLTGLLSSFSKGKAGASLLNGIISASYLVLPGSTNPWVSFAKGILAKYDVGAPWDGNSEYGVALGVTFAELLKATGKDLTRSRLVKTLETSGKNLVSPGLVPFTYSASDHYGYSGSEMVQIENGVATSISPVYVTTNKGPITVYHGTVKAPPSKI